MASVTRCGVYHCYQGLDLTMVAMLVWLTVAIPVTAAESAAPISVAMDQVSWQNRSDPFICKLELDLGKNGRLAFIHAAGSEGHFHYFPDPSPVGSVHLASVTAPWMPSTRSEWVRLEEEQDSFRLSPGQTAALIRAMDSGLWTSLRVDNTEIRIPTIRWQAARKLYQQCEKALSPLSVAQARDTVVHFARGQSALTEAQLEQLARLARYARLDPAITRILVDGHTDKVGNRIANLQLSRQWARDVAAALSNAGVDERLLEVRAHGDRYPVSENDSRKGVNGTGV